jgi:hypothetical protein
MLSPPPRASTLLLAPFQFHLFFFLWCCYLILPALRSILDVHDDDALVALDPRAGGG